MSFENHRTEMSQDLKKVPSLFMNSDSMYQMCVAGQKKGWEEAGLYLQAVISWKGWKLSVQEKEDLVQETLLYFVSGGLEKVNTPSAFKKLLRMKLQGNIIDRWRKSGPVNTENDVDTFPCHSPDLVGSLFTKQAFSICMEIVRAMKDERCTKILLRYFKYKNLGEKISRIAEEMQKPQGTIAAIIHRCLEQLYENPKMLQLRDLLKHSIG